MSYLVLEDLTSRHLALARSATARSEKDSAEVIAAVVFAAAAFEAFLSSVVNSAGIHFNEPDHPDLAALTKLAEVIPVLEEVSAQWSIKLQVITTVLQGAPLLRGAQPYQDLDLLFRLRNTLLHPKLHWKVEPADDPKSEHNRLVPLLLVRGAVDEPDPLPPFPPGFGDGRPLMPPPSMSLLQPGVARWAVRVAEDSIDAVVSMVPSPRHRTLLKESASGTWSADAG